VTGPDPPASDLVLHTYERSRELILGHSFEESILRVGG
jgi:hypothetical protein